MKFILALCLLGMAMDATSAGTVPSICTEGLEAYNAFRECVQQYLPDQTALDQHTGRRTISDFLTQLCGPTLENARQCFQSKIGNCDESIHRELTSLARESGVFCDHGGPSINPAAVYVVGSLDWSGVDDTPCLEPNTDVCYQEALVAMMDANFWYTRLHMLSMEQLSSTLTSYFRADMACVVRLQRENADRCPVWRGKAVTEIFYRVMFQPLGVTMPFTFQELNEMLGL